MRDAVTTERDLWTNKTRVTKQSRKSRDVKKIQRPHTVSYSIPDAVRMQCFDLPRECTDLTSNLSKLCHPGCEPAELPLPTNLSSIRADMRIFGALYTVKHGGYVRTWLSRDLQSGYACRASRCASSPENYCSLCAWNCSAPHHLFWTNLLLPRLCRQKHGASTIRAVLRRLIRENVLLYILNKSSRG